IFLEYYQKCDMQKMLCIFPDGIPAKITSSLLPARSRLSLAVWLHVLLANKVKGPKTNSGSHAQKNGTTHQRELSRENVVRLVRHLLETIADLNKTKSTAASVWRNYCRETILS